MAHTDILNPTPTHSLNPDYGWQKKRPVTHVVVKASQGAAYYREMTDLAHQFQLTWGTTIDNQKSADEVSRLKWFYEQYKDGFFTLIDHEGGGRHYVGRFTSPVEPIPVGHNRWAAQNVLFEEVPGVAMLKYPHRWDKDAIWRYPFSDFGELKVALTGNWHVEADGPLSLTGTDLLWSAGTAGDSAQMAYVGYGFQFWAATGNASGIAHLYLDGNLVATIDQYSTGLAASMLHQELNVPLGQHLVKLEATNTKNSSSSGTAIIWDSLKVMR